MLSDAQAYDEINALFAAAWADATATEEIVLLFENTNEARPDPTAELVPWALAGWKRVTSKQTSLGGDNGQAKWTTYGLYTVQLFAPIGDGSALLFGMGDVFTTTFRNHRTEGGVTFRNVRVKDIGASGPWWYHKAIAETEHDSVSP